MFRTLGSYRTELSVTQLLGGGIKRNIGSPTWGFVGLARALPRGSRSVLGVGGLDDAPLRLAALAAGLDRWVGVEAFGLDDGV